MASLDPEKLPHDFPRHYLPQGVRLGSWETLRPLLEELEHRPLSSTDDLEKWLADLQELEEALDEEGSVRYVRMTCQTDDPALEGQYLQFLEEVAEPAKPRFFALMKKYWECPHRTGLSAADFRLYNRSVENQLALYREENTPLETKLDKLSQQYQKLSGSLTVVYEGQEKTLQQMGPYQESTDRRQREETWRLVAQRRLKDKDAFEALFDEMRGLRGEIAKNAGFPNYRDYMFRRKERFDYGPKDCEDFHESAAKAVRPLVLEIQKKRAQKMGLPSLRPWDLSVDPQGLAPLKPFESTDQLTAGCQKILGQVDPEFGAHFQKMRDLGLLDLESRKGKAPGGYNTTLSEARLPFIFMNSVGLDGDMRTLLHEGGHALHAFASRTIPFSPYRHAPMEFCEVASMSMELLADPYLEAFYPSPKDAARSARKHLEDVITLLPWIATIDAFQHWIYTHPDHTPSQRSDHWIALRDRLGGGEDWTGLEEARRSLWHRQLHIFEVPFYYIEYGIAQLGALQVWKNVREKGRAGVEAYKKGLAVGGSQTLPEIFKSAGIQFDFSLRMIEPLMEEVQKELQKLDKIS
ncbi:MAG TPA: M3 family oligoendopeptidase [bacterium]|nr:M3 family oligoendopeptidase [bacterium]